jgi:RNA polymerase sigma-70 factor (ECF subfamily)
MSGVFYLTPTGKHATMEGVSVARDSSAPGAGEVKDLVERARRRDGAAFRDLFRIHVGVVHRVIYRLVGPGNDVEDLVQTAFVEAFRSLPDFRGDALFSTWLTRIAVRVTFHAKRRRSPFALSMDDMAEPAVDQAGPERVAAAREGLALLQVVLAELRPKRRAAFVLHVLEGHSMEEVAAILNASVAAVKVRVHDARRHIERRCKTRPELADCLQGRR